MGQRGSKSLSREAVIKAKEMYEERDSRGRRVHSHMSIGKFLGVSETTVYRAIHSFGAFMDVPDLPTQEFLKDRERESLVKLYQLGALPIEALPPDLQEVVRNQPPAGEPKPALYPAGTLTDEEIARAEKYGVKRR